MAASAALSLPLLPSSLFLEGEGEGEGGEGEGERERAPCVLSLLLVSSSSACEEREVREGAREKHWLGVLRTRSTLSSAVVKRQLPSGDQLQPRAKLFFLPSFPLLALDGLRSRSSSASSRVASDMALRKSWVVVVWREGEGKRRGHTSFCFFLHTLSELCFTPPTRNRHCRCCCWLKTEQRCKGCPENRRFLIDATHDGTGLVWSKAGAEWLREEPEPVAFPAAGHVSSTLAWWGNNLACYSESLSLL